MRLWQAEITVFGNGEQDIVDYDVIDAGPPAMLLQDARGRRVWAGGREITAMSSAQLASASAVRVLPDGVLVGPVNLGGDGPADGWVAAYDSGISQARLGGPSRFFTAGAFIFATYLERVLLEAGGAPYEDDVVTALDARTLKRVCGLSELLTGRHDEPDAYEVLAGCASASGAFTFFSLGSPYLWTMNADSLSVTAVAAQLPAEPEAIEALTIAGDCAVAFLTGAEAVDLVWLDLCSGREVKRATLPASRFADLLGSFATPRPAGGWALDAEVRGTNGGQFIFRAARRVAILSV